MQPPARTLLRLPTMPARQQLFLQALQRQTVEPEPGRQQTAQVSVHWPQPLPGLPSTAPRLLPAWQR